MAIELCFCIPPVFTYHMVGVCSCVAAFISLIPLIFVPYEFFFWIPITICCGITSGFYFASFCLANNLYSKIFAYTYAISTLICAAYYCIILSIIFSEFSYKAIWWQPLLAWLAYALITLYLFLCVMAHVNRGQAMQALPIVYNQNY